MQLRFCAIVPTYKHIASLEAIVAHLRSAGLYVFIVDDGNETEISERIATICDRYEGVECVRHALNSGKGAAVLTGLAQAAREGFTHAVQVDADGQHDIARVADLIARARQQPDALITGQPVFDETVPKVRLIARWITHFWVSVNTLSFRIIDSMCGFRVYPVAATLAVASEANIAKRMGFDSEILVRLIWRGIPVTALPVRVVYPPRNHSNFKAWDNVEVSRMHAKLFFLMLFKIPSLIARRTLAQQTPSRHWARIGERGSSLGLSILAGVFRFFGRRVCLAIMLPVVLFFFLTGTEQRRASMSYLERAWNAGALSRRPNWASSFLHFLSFGAAALDKFAAWTGNISIADVDGADDGEFQASQRSGRGALILTAHLGNPEVIRAVASLSNRSRVNVLVHTAHAMRFNALINAHSSSSTVRMIQVTEIGPDTAILLQTAICNGEWVVMVGDRVPVNDDGRISWAKFLGAPAPFAQGPHILGAILKCPVYLLFCLRIGNRFRIFFEPFAERIELPRAQRQKAIDASIARYAERLEFYLRLAPMQWFNFFDYWRAPVAKHPGATTSQAAEREMAS